MKRGVMSLAIGAMLVAGGISLTAAVPVTSMKLKTLKPTDTFFTGELEAINKSVFSFEEPGTLQSIAQVGDYVFAPIKTDDGKIVRPGTVLARQKLDKKEYELKAAIMAKKIAEATFDSAKRDFVRNQKLVQKNIVSMKEYQDSKTALMTAKMNLDKAGSDVMIKQYLLDRATIVSPFSGVVTKTFIAAGALAGDGDECIEVTRMSPLLVKIPFPEDIIDSFKEGTVVKVYPANCAKPVYAWSNASLDHKHLFAYVDNKVIPTDKLTADQQKLKKVYVLFPVVDTSDSHKVVGQYLDTKSKMLDIEQPISVPENTIYHDDKGSYVLKAEGFNSRDTNSNLFQFQVKKIYVKKGDIQRDFFVGLGRDVVITSLADPGSLQIGDVLVLKGQDGIEDGDTVIKENIRWKFMPNQAVKIEIPTLSGEGLYVPASAVIHQASGSNFVYTIVDGKAKLVEVEITGRSSGYNRITGNW